MTATDRLHVVTGPPGSGKSTLVAALAAQGIATSDEVGRRIVREQVAAGGTALPWDDEAAFARLMIPGEIDARATALARGGAVVLDRGVPDVAGFLVASGLPVPADLDAAAMACRYNPRVFIAPSWPAIFVQDAERPLPVGAYRRAEAALREVYARYRYRLVELPCGSVAERVAFVRAGIGA